MAVSSTSSRSFVTGSADPVQLALRHAHRPPVRGGLGSALVAGIFTRVTEDPLGEDDKLLAGRVEVDVPTAAVVQYLGQHSGQRLDIGVVDVEVQQRPLLGLFVGGVARRALLSFTTVNEMPSSTAPVRKLSAINTPATMTHANRDVRQQRRATVSKDRCISARTPGSGTGVAGKRSHKRDQPQVR